MVILIWPETKNTTVYYKKNTGLSTLKNSFAGITTKRNDVITQAFPGLVSLAG